MPAIGCADDSVDVASQRSGPRTAAKSKAGPSQRVEDSAMRIVKEEDKEADDIPLEDATFERLKQRRHMRGANTSDVDFAHLFNSLAKMNDCFQQEPAEEIDTSDTILHKVRLWQDCVRKTFADGSDYFIRLGVGVLAFGRARQADIFLREHALLYWVAEGHSTLRFHTGDCYMKTPSGAFQQHRGIPPDHDRVQTFLLHVEGIFRKMPVRTHRTTAGLLGAMKNILLDYDNQENQFLAACVNACLTFEGQQRKEKNREEHADEEQEGPGQQGPQGPWNAATAKTIMAVKKQLSYELCQDKLLHFMSEWCDTPKEVEASCCYEDCAVKYDDELLPARQIQREQLVNCYLRIPHSIKQTVPADIVERLRKFYSQTFWGNIEAFKCGQAAQALAKRGLNVVRLFIGLSSGGVGQSLYSTHLQAMYAHNFAFFDPGVWFHEDEMRKQVEQLNGRCILTGQESPSGTGRAWARVWVCNLLVLVLLFDVAIVCLTETVTLYTQGKLREDLFKKFVSGDGIAGRKPYGFSTKMIHCVGWKRLEANRMFTFEDVGKRNFNAILRRALVWRARARFEDPQVIASAYADIHKDGVFPKDPDLASFLTSSAAVAAALQIQHAFEAEYSKQACIDMIENYVTWGGDGGLTEQTMREACRLPPRDIRAANTKFSAVIHLDEVEDDEEKEQKAQWCAAREAVMDVAFSKKKIFFPEALLTSLKAKGGPNVSREGLLDGLLNMKYLQRLPGSKKADTRYIPVLTAEVSLCDILHHQDRICELELSEMYNIDKFSNYLTQHPHRAANSKILADVLQASSESRRPRAGRPSPEEVKQKEDMQARSRKLRSGETHGEELLEALTEPIQKKRKFSQKKPEVKTENSEDHILIRKVNYQYPGPCTIRTRKQVVGIGAQKLSRRAQVMLLDQTHDLDIENCLFTLLPQLLEKLKLDPPMPPDALAAFAQCRSQRTKVCADVLQLPLHVGKELLVSILYGGHVSGKLVRHDFVQSLQRASMYCKWAAASSLPEEFASFVEDTTKKNPDSSVLAYLYMAAEDYVLSHWCDHLLTFSPTHLSLHFDGVRISPLQGISIEEVCKQSASYILDKTGFKVTIREKRHETVNALIKKAAACAKRAPFPTDHVYCVPGNCIPHALASLGAITEEKVSLLTEACPDNAYMQQRGCRTYLQCSNMFHCSFSPVLCTQSFDFRGNFLLHSENGGSPHCVAVKQDEEDKLIVFDTDGVFHLAVADFETALLGGVDAATCVIFKLQDGKKDTDVGMSDFENLLDLAAGSSESNEECTTDDAQDTALLPEVSEKKGSFDWLDDTGRVITDQVLLSDLQTEAQKFMEAAKAGQFRAERGAFQCPACPFRKFDRCKRLAVHLSRYHTAKRQFCCSGTKQIKIILALHDSDMIAEKRQGNYLKRSATLLRRSIKPMLSPQNNAVDKEIRFLLDASDPRVVHRQALRSARRVGNMYYTHSFAERIFQEMLLNHAKARGDEKGSMVAQHVL